MSRLFITTGHSGRRQASEFRSTETHTCHDVFTGVAEKLILLFLAQTGKLPTVLPVDLLLPQHFRVCLGPHVFLICSHQLLTNEWNWLDSPAEDAVLVAHLHVQLYVPLFGYSTVSQGLNPQKAAFAHSVPDGSLGGQTRALAHIT